MISEERVIELAGKAASRYKRRVWWASHEDMQQEAVQAIMDGMRRFDPDYGVEPGAYAWQVAIYAVRRYVLKQSAPVSAHHRLDVLKGLMRSEVSPTISDDQASPEDIAHRARLAQSVHARVHSILGEDGAEFAIGVLGGEYRPREVMQEHGLAPVVVYRALRKTRAMLLADDELYNLWREA